jgi:hypothetical protein
MPLSAGGTLGAVGSDALLGFQMRGPWGALAGGVLGGISSLFSKDPEKERQDRLNAYLAQIRQLREQSLGQLDTDVNQGLKDIYQNTTNQAAQSRQAAARRATALGRSSDAEGFIQPLQQQIYGGGSQATGNLLEQQVALRKQIGNQYDMMEANAQGGFADRPIQPSVSDYLTNVGGQVAQFCAAQKSIESQTDFNKAYLDILRNSMGGTEQRGVNEILGSRVGQLTLPDYGRNPIVTNPSQWSTFGNSDLMRRPAGGW